MKEAEIGWEGTRLSSSDIEQIRRLLTTIDENLDLMVDWENKYAKRIERIEQSLVNILYEVSQLKKLVKKKLKEQ